MKNHSFLYASILLGGLVVVLAAFLFLSGGTRSSPSGDISLIETDRLEAELKNPAPPFLLDVREPSEFEEIRIDGAVLIPLGELAARVSEIPKDRPIIVYCRSGRRSGMAAEILRENGFENVRNLVGGINAWAARRGCRVSSGVC